MSDKIEAGNVVRSKAGGPKMTVHRIEGLTVWCRWFDDKSHLHSGQFTLGELERLSE